MEFFSPDLRLWQQAQAGGHDFRHRDVFHAGGIVRTARFPMNARNAVMAALALNLADHAMLCVICRQPELRRGRTKNADARNPQRGGDVQQAGINAHKQTAFRDNRAGFFER